jgi:transcriptional regulator GlxA family with amidase domain
MNQGSVAVVAFEGISPFHLSVPCLVFGEDRRGDGIPPYDMRVCVAGRSRRVETSAGFSITADHGLEGLSGAATVIVPSWRSTAETPPPALLDGLRRAHDGGARIVGLCLGAFVVAAAGLLDGRRATTHWRYAGELAARFSAVQVDPDRLWVDLDDVVTSAGTAAALDCCVHLVRRDHGADVANRLARRLVIAPHRSGDQSQYIERPVTSTDAPDELGSALDWARRHLDQPIGVDELAARAHLSRRSFTRHFRAVTGTSPHQWLLHERLTVAQTLLETTNISIELVAERSGIGSAATLRQHYQRRFGTSPQSYRTAFTRAR